LIGQCDPLLQLKTTTSETVFLQEVRASDENSEEKKSDAIVADFQALNIGESDNEGIFETVLREMTTSSSGLRRVSIKPVRRNFTPDTYKSTTPS